MNRVPAPAPEPGRLAFQIARASLLALAFVLPLSIALTEGALVIGLSALLVARFQGRPWTFAHSWLEPAQLAVVGAWLLSTAFSAEPVGSLLHVRKLYAFGLVYLAAEAARDPAVRRRVVELILAGSVLAAAAGYIIFYFRVLSWPGYRYQSLMSTAMTTGNVLCAAALWALGPMCAARGARRALAVLALIVLLPALLLTQTRSSWLGFGVGAIVILLVLARRWWWIVPLGFAATLRFAPGRLAARFASILDPHDPTSQGRLSMWRSARDIVQEHPWIGVGCQDLLALYHRYRYPDWTFESGHFHNNFIQIAVMTGAVGLLAFLFWHAAVARQLWRASRAAAGEDRGVALAALGIFAALVVSGMFDFTFGDQEVVDHTYIGLGLALAILPPRPAGRPPGLAP